MNRDEVIALVIAKAHEHGLVGWEFLGGIIAEGLDVHASRPVNQADWRRYWDPPEPRFDVSFGLGQKNARFAEEYRAICRERGIPFELGGPADVYPGDEAIARIRDAYYDPHHALDVAAAGYRHFRYDPEIDPLHAWVSYNGPIYYKQLPWQSSPVMGHYRDSLAEARRILETTVPTTLAYNPDTPRSVQINSYTCSIRATHWMLLSLGIDVPIETLHDRMVPSLVTPELGLLNVRGYGHGIEDVLREHIPAEHHHRIRRLPDVSYSQAITMIGKGPVALGGRKWEHWAGASRVHADETIEIKNPARNGYGGVTDRMTRNDWDRLGTFGLVWVDMSEAVVVPPTDELAALRARNAELETSLASVRADLDDARTKLGVGTVNYANDLEHAARGILGTVEALRALHKAA